MKFYLLLLLAIITGQANAQTRKQTIDADCLRIRDGVCIDKNELGYSDGLSSNTQTQLNTLDGRIDTVESDVSDVVLDVADHEGRITAEEGVSVDHETRLDAVEANKVTGPASSVDNAVTRFDGVSGKLIQNSNVTLSDTAEISAASGNDLTLTTASTSDGVQVPRNIRHQALVSNNMSNDSTSGTSVTLAAPTTKNVRLVASVGTLISISMIPAGLSGQDLVLINETGATVTINNDTGGTAANRIITGTGAAIKLKNRATLPLVYDFVYSRWYVAAGVGGGGTGLGDTDTMFVQDFESVSLTDFTQTGMALDSTNEINGEISASLVHATATTTYSFKQSVTVPLKFRGKNITIKLTGKSTATSGNVVLDAGCASDTELLNGELLAASTATGGVELYAYFDLPTTCTSLSYTVRALPQTGPPTTYIDDIEIKLTKIEVATGTIETPDSWVVVSNATYASNYFHTFTFSTFIGSDISYTNNASTGAMLIANTSGIYDFNFGYSFTTASIQSNIVVVTKYSAAGVSQGNVGHDSGYNATGYNGNVIATSGSVYLAAGEYLKFYSSGSGTPVFQTLTMSKQGSLKRVVVNRNQKITIPTSEVRFEGTNTLGTADGGFRVNFDALTKLKGDALTPTDDATGTSVTIRKKGIVHVTSTFLNAAGSSASCYIKKSTTTYYMGGMTANPSFFCHAKWSGEVDAGDIISIVASPAPASNTSNSFTVTFQEQEVQVSVSNTLPQYSESDLTVKAIGNAGQTITANVTDIPFITQSDTTGGAWSGSAFTVPSNGVYTFSGQAYFTAGSSRAFDLYVNGATYKRISDDVVQTAHKFSHNEYFTAGQVVSIRSTVGGTLNNNTLYHHLTITKIGKPNVTGVDVTPFIEIPRLEKQTAYLNAASTTAGAVFKGALTTSIGSGIFSYSSTTGVFTAIKNCTMQLDFAGQASGAAAQALIYHAAVFKSVPQTSAASLWANGTLRVPLTAGETMYAYVNSGTFSGAHITVSAEAESDQIATPVESFSSDSATFTYANAATYTLSTLANAPVGTYITHYFTASTTNTKTQTTGVQRPTQTDLAINSSGIYMEGRPYAGTGNTTTPPYVSIQIGKGFKNVVLNAYASANKAGEKVVLSPYFNAAVHTGLVAQGMDAYNPETGILTLDIGTNYSNATTSRGFLRESSNYQLGAYITINASKTPQLSGISYVAPRVAWLKDVKASGTQGGAAIAGTQTRTLNTEDDASDFVTLASNQFTLPAGEYIIEAIAPAFSVAAHKARLRNITDASTALIGTNAYNSNAAGYAQTESKIDGRITITSSKVFEIQHYTQVAFATNGLGVQTGTGESEIYTQVKITKVK